MTASDLVLWFSEIGPDDAALVGGKAHSLGALTRAGFTVPEGFVLTTRALTSALAEPTLAAIANDPAALRARLLDTPLPEAVAATLRQEYAKTFHEDTPLAVRSSGTKE